MTKLVIIREDDLNEMKYAPLTILQVKAIVTQIDTNYKDMFDKVQNINNELLKL